MKKFFIAIATVALVATASCTKVTPDESSSAINNKITFNVGNYVPQTKANVALETITESFKTTAKYFPADASLAVQDYMTNVDVNFTEGTPNVWAPARDYYWPKTGFINFYSYYNTANLDPAITFDTDTKKNATATYTNKVIGSAAEILLADAALNQTQNLQKYVETSKVTSGVPTLFHHLLAKIRFDVKLQTTEAKKANTTKFVVTILNTTANPTNLKAQQKGSLTLTNTYAAGTDPVAWTTPTVWTLPTAAADQQVETIAMLTPSLTLNAGATSTTASDLLKARTVLPQTLGDDVVFTINYKVETYYVDPETGAESQPYMTEIITASKKLTAFTSAITAWNINTQNVYHIIIDPVGNKITFDPAVVDYAAETDGGTYSLPE